jgi:leucyl aminopeptidase
MNVTLISQDPLKVKTGCLIVGIGKNGRLTPTAKALDEASKGAVTKYIESGDIHTCVGHTALFHGFAGCKAERVLFVGIGKEPMTQKEWLKAVNTGLKAAYTAKTVTLCCNEWIAEDDEFWLVQLASQAALTAFDKPVSLKTKEIPWKAPEEVQIVVKGDAEELEAASDVGLAVSFGMKIAKHLGDLPANVCTPSYFAEFTQNFVKDAAKDKAPISCKVFDADDLVKLNMGCFLGVAQGSHEEPKMVRIDYKGGKKHDKPVVLIGKGLTFDSGGISIKPAAGMDEMKYDMSGAASVLGTIAAAASLGLPINVTGLVGCTENMPGGGAVKPGDILRAYNGKTVEVLNTDAEGRLVLCDLLAYAADKLDPELMIDVCTLTGACVVALGNDFTGLFSNRDDLAYDLLDAGEMAMDYAWRMPLAPEFTRALDSNFADLTNVSGARWGGACTAAAFLECFVGDTPWAHLDIAGTGYKSGKEKGSTGRPVPLLLNYLIAHSFAEDEE